MSDNVYKDPRRNKTVQVLQLPMAALWKAPDDGKTYVMKDGDWVELEEGNIVVDDELSSVSENPVQNRIIKRVLDNKQNILSSGTNIKTINGQNILGPGNIEIKEGQDIVVDNFISNTSENPVQNKVISKFVDKKQDYLINQYNIKSINGESILGGGNLDIKSDIPVATQDKIGGIKPGAGVRVSEDGTLDVTGGGVADSVDWDNVLNKPDIKQVAVTGDYNDLINTPLIPSKLSDLESDADNRTVTDAEKQSWNNKSDFDGSYNSLTDKPAIPAKTSDLENDSDFINSGSISDMLTKTEASNTYQPAGDYVTNDDLTGKDFATKTDLSSKQDILVSQENIKSINGQSLLGKGNIQIEGGGGSSVNVVDDLQSESTTDALSANQGRVLKGLVDGKQPAGDYALRTEIPDTSDMLTKTEASTTYQKQGDYVTNDELSGKGYITEIPKATNTVLGGVKVGAGLQVSKDGLLSATGGGVADSVDWENVQNKPSNLADWNAVEGETSIANKPNIPSSLSQLTEDSSHRVVTDEEKNVWNAKSDFNGDYNSLSNLPAIPTNTSDLTNDSNFVSDASYVHTDTNFTQAEKAKLGGIEEGAQVNIISSDAPLDGNVYGRNNGQWVQVVGGGGETSDYNSLLNKPKIGGIELIGDKTLDELNIQAKGNYATKEDLTEIFIRRW